MLTKVSDPDDGSILISELVVEKVTTSPSASVAVKVPIPVLFSLTVKEVEDVIAGVLSLTLFMFIEISCCTK